MCKNTYRFQVLLLVRHSSDDEYVQEHTDGPNVHLAVVGLADHHLRCDVVGRSEEGAPKQIRIA